MIKSSIFGNALTTSHSNKDFSKRINTVIGFLLIVSFILKVTASLYSAYRFDLNSWWISEFLINYQGGFVRRGLLGEVLYQLYTLFHLPLRDSIFCFSYIVFLCVVLFFYRQFRRHDICWWLLLSPLFLNYTFDIVRKDYILYAILICVVYLLRPSTHDILKKAIACVLVVVSLLIHEAFLFWGVVLYAILLLSDQRHRTFNYLLVALPIAVAVLTALFKGNVNTAHDIISSWNTILQGQPLVYTGNNSIGAIGWDSIGTFVGHLRQNVSVGGGGLLLLPLSLAAAYYLFSNYMEFFHKGTSDDRNAKRLEISLLYPIFCISLMPMLTILSCDTGRVFQYATISTFSAFLIIPQHRVLEIFPLWYKKLIIRFNLWLDCHFPPAKAIIVFLLLTLAVSNSHFNLSTAWCESVVGSFVRNGLIIVLKFAKLIFIHA